MQAEAKIQVTFAKQAVWCARYKAALEIAQHPPPVMAKMDAAD